MKLSLKRTCKNCIADRDSMGCELGYKNEFIPMQGSIPKEPCLKPLTNKDYLEAMYHHRLYEEKIVSK